MKGSSHRVAALVGTLLMLTGRGALHGGTGTNASAAQPEPRSSASLAFDAKTGQLVLFGGAAEQSLGDTWVWQSSSWRQVQPPTSPPPRENAALGYDPAGGQLVLFGGDSVGDGGQVRDHTDTWTWDGSSWTEQHPRHHPAFGISPRMATDAARGVLLLVTQPGNTSSSLAPVQTWTLRDNDWHAESGDSAPLAGVFAAGSGHQGLADGGDARPIAGSNDYTGSAGIGWDPVSRHVLYVEHVVVADAPVPQNGLVTWSWDGKWRLEHPPRTPAPSSDPLVATDSIGVVLLGGDGQTWHWNGATWAQLDVSGPPARAAGAIAYDSVAKLTRITGGVATAQPGGVYDDLWTWNGTVWSRSAGRAVAQAVPQPEATMPPTHVSREQAIASARKFFPDLGAVTRVDSGPLSRFAEGFGSAGGRRWVWVVVFGNAPAIAEGGPCCYRGPQTPPPQSHGMMIFVDYQTGQSLSAESPVPAWLLHPQR